MERVCVCEREGEKQNGRKRFTFSGSVLVFSKSVSPSEGLAQGQAAASAPLEAAIGFKQQLRVSPLPGSVIRFPGPESLSNSLVNSHKFLIQGGSLSRDFSTQTVIGLLYVLIEDTEGHFWCFHTSPKGTGLCSKVES